MNGAKRALEAYRAVLQGQHFTEILGDETRAKDLAEWNKMQYSIWMKGVSDGKVERRDVDTFGRFGKWFFDVVDTTEAYPTYQDFLQWIAQKT